MTTSAASSFDSSSIWSTIRSFAKRLGGAGLEATLIAWSLVNDPEVDARAKAIVVSALVYLGVPTDAVPDIIPIAGLTDDIAVLLAAVVTVAWAIRPHHQAFARERMKDWGIA